MKKALDGLVIREVEIGESDKLLTVLTASEGKITISAKGVRSSKSKFFGLCRLYTYANYEYYEKGGMRWLAGGSVNDSFFGLSQNLSGFALAAYLLDVAAEVTGEGMPEEEILRLMLNSLWAITQKNKPYTQIKAAFEFYAAKHSGFCPDFNGCGGCGKNASLMYLDVMNGALICSECLDRNPIRTRNEVSGDFFARNIFLPLDTAALSAVRYVISSEVKRIFAFEIKAEESLMQFSAAGERYLLNHLERGFETLKFYHSVADI